MAAWEPVEVDRADSATMSLMGRLRYDVWKDEGELDMALFPDGVWLDVADTEANARHWIVRDDAGDVIAAARLTLLNELAEDNRDAMVWKRCGAELPLPTVDLSRLVVHRSARGRGVAQSLNRVRVQAARDMGARSVMATASEANARLLLKLGFADIGERVVFSDRPRVPFWALQLNL
jgi:predicted GNAT family N-acyltransferase